MTSTVTRIPAHERALATISWAVFGLGLIKFFAIAIPAGADHAPWYFLLVLVSPFAAGSLLLRANARAGAAVIGLFAALMASLCVIAVVQGIEYWHDWLLVALGGPLYVIAVGLSVRMLRTR
jgi:hypothetical protein